MLQQLGQATGQLSSTQVPNVLPDTSPAPMGNQNADLALKMLYRTAATSSSWYQTDVMRAARVPILLTPHVCQCHLLHRGV